MLKLVPPSDERFRSFIFAQIGTALAFVIGIVVLASTILCPRAYSSREITFQRSLSQVGEWIDRSGKITVIRANIAEKLGLQNVDLRVHERGFRIRGEQFTHVCSTADLPGFQEIMFLALVDEATGDAVIWRATRTGDLVRTARFEDGLAKTVPNETEQTAFAVEKEYFLKRFRAETFRNNPAPPYTLQATPRPLELAVEANVRTRSRQATLPSEITVLLLYPWVIPVVIAALVMGACVKSRR
jgi:hypothetical protein